MKRLINSLCLYTDDHYSVYLKDTGVLTQPDNSGDESLYDHVSKAVPHSLYLCHRLDRPVSGMVVMAHSAEAQQQFAIATTAKVYYAISHQGEMAPEGKIEAYLKRDGRKKRAYINDVQKPGYKSVTMDYRIVHRLDRYDLIKVEIRSGRFHQIRALLGHMGCPIKGDVKYGARRANKDRSIYLHNYSLKSELFSKEVFCPPNIEDSLWALCYPHF